MINWYPGHMSKTSNLIRESLKLVDLVLEVVDARIPESSSNPELTELLSGNIQRLILLNKADLAHPGLTRQWRDYFNYPGFALNSTRGQGLSSLLDYLEDFQQQRDTRASGRPLKLLVVGIPNVGKSTFINSLPGTGRARTGKKPGVTRGKQWIKISSNIQLMDTPGVLWPGLENEETAFKLAVTGAIPEKNFDTELAAYRLIQYILSAAPGILQEKYNLSFTGDQPYDILPLIGKKRGCLQSGGRVDRNRAASLILNDFRQGKLGRITLEKPPHERDDIHEN
ncbi:MAG: ribosome biogenesis GTPase YlqF [Bacillota bacterium]